MKILSIICASILLSLGAFTQVPVSKPIQGTYEPASSLGYRNSVGIGFGQAFLFSDFSTLGEDSLTYDIFYSYKASYTFDLLVNTHLNKHDTNSSGIELGSLNVGVKAKIFNFDSFSPFWSLGAGFYWPKASYLEASKEVESEGKTVFGLNASLGMDLKLNKRFSIGFTSHLHYPLKSSLPNGSSLSGAYLKLLIVPSISF